MSGPGASGRGTRARRGLGAVLLAAVTAGAVLAETAPPPPAWVEITPNAIQQRHQPMRIEVGGIPPGRRVELAVLRDCTLDGAPDDSEDCPPLLVRDSPQADAASRVRDTLVLADLETREGELADVGLWLRVRHPGGTRARWARFGYVEDPCSLWTTVLETFLGGDCDPGLGQALRQHRGPATLDDHRFEVRLLDTGERTARPAPVPATAGATGVAWAGPETLLVTLAPAADPAPREGAPGPGLYRVDLESGRRTLLWQPEDPAYRPAAPRALPGERIAFVRQRDGEHGDGLPAAYLTVLDAAGKPTADHPLHRRVHQLVAHDREGGEVLALTLGEAENRPAFLRVDLASGEVETVGYHHALYRAAMRSPTGGAAVIAFENSYGEYGWDLVLLDRDGRARDVQTRHGHDLLPAWHPGGRRLAYLAEVPAPPQGEAGGEGETP